MPVFFEKENINTLDAKGEVLLTIMASLAQQESESLSKNVKMGLQFRYQNGEVQINHNWFLGYTKDENGHLIIDEEQAVVVRRIFREYLQGASLKNIADGLMAVSYTHLDVYKRQEQLLTHGANTSLRRLSTEEVKDLFHLMTVMKCRNTQIHMWTLS